jgi:Tfp pilus assembly protein PilO
MARTKAEFRIAFLGRVQVLLALAAGLGVAAFYLMVYRPQAQLGQDLVNRIVSRQKELISETATAQNLPVVEAQVADLNRRLAGLKHVPTKPDIGDFMSEINRLSGVSALTKMDVQPGTTRESAVYDERPVKLTFQGDFEGVFEFLAGVEGLQRLTRISSVKLHAVAGKPGQVSAEVSVCIYYHNA